MEKLRSLKKKKQSQKNKDVDDENDIDDSEDQEDQENEDIEESQGPETIAQKMDRLRKLKENGSGGSSSDAEQRFLALVDKELELRGYSTVKEMCDCEGINAYKELLKKASRQYTEMKNSVDPKVQKEFDRLIKKKIKQVDELDDDELDDLDDEDIEEDIDEDEEEESTSSFYSMSSAKRSKVLLSMSKSWPNKDNYALLLKNSLKSLSEEEATDDSDDSDEEPEEKVDPVAVYAAQVKTVRRDCANLKRYIDEDLIRNLNSVIEKLAKPDDPNNKEVIESIANNGVVKKIKKSIDKAVELLVFT